MPVANRTAVQCPANQGGPMKRFLASFTLLLGLVCLAPRAFADGAIICTGDSSGACKGRSYCCYHGGESEGDKYCQNLGCRRGGTSSCPTGHGSTCHRACSTAPRGSTSATTTPRSAGPPSRARPSRRLGRPAFIIAAGGWTRNRLRSVLQQQDLTAGLAGAPLCPALRSIKTASSLWREV